MVSLMGSLLHLIHLSCSGSCLSTQYPVMGLPPSSSGSYQDKVSESLAMSEGSSLYGAPGVSEGQSSLSFTQQSNERTYYKVKARFYIY